jgi:transposase-like protein
MLAGESVKDLAAELDASDSSLYKWRRKALIEVGRVPGLKTYEADGLAEARRRVKDLEAELTLVKAAAALFDETEAIRVCGNACVVLPGRPEPEVSASRLGTRMTTASDLQR